MPLAKNNRLTQPPNTAWTALSANTLPVEEMVAFSDAEKKRIWLGNVATEESFAPSLNGLEVAFWSHIAGQPDVSDQ
jgi:hypothetical protein